MELWHVYRLKKKTKNTCECRLTGKNDPYQVGDMWRCALHRQWWKYITDDFGKDRWIRITRFNADISLLRREIWST